MNLPDEVRATLDDGDHQAEVEALRRIANVNGDWNVKLLHEQAIKDEAIARAEKAEAAIERTVRYLRDPMSSIHPGDPRFVPVNTVLRYLGGES